MPKVLPSIHDANSPNELHKRDKVPKDETSQRHLPFGEGWSNSFHARLEDNRLSHARVFPTRQSSSKHRMAAPGQILGQTQCINSKQSQETRQHPLGNADALSPDSNIVFLLANTFLLIEITHGITRDCLNDLLEDDISNHVPARDMVSLENLCGCVQAVLREEIVDVDKMIDQ